MSKKALMIGVAVIVLALGVVGAASATGMTFSNVGALSSHQYSVPPKVNADKVVYITSGGLVVSVTLSFDSDLKAGSQIHVALLDKNANVIDQGRTAVDGLAYDLPAADTVDIVLNGGNQTLDSIDSAKVTVAPSFEP